jgi:hypothetical protein
MCESVQSASVVLSPRLSLAAGSIARKRSCHGESVRSWSSPAQLKVCRVARLTYDDQLLRRLPPNSGVWVRGLCERSDPYLAAYAGTLERWFAEMGGNNRLRVALTSADDNTFQAARWELTAARLFHNLAFGVEFEPRIQSDPEGSSPQTPDFKAARNDVRPLVEVFNLNPSASERAEDENRYRLSVDLASSLSIPRGFLSLILRSQAVLDPYPDQASIRALAEVVQAWWNDGCKGMLSAPAGPISVYGQWFDTDEAFIVVVGPATRFLSPDRIRSRLEDKLGRYKHLSGQQIILFLGSDYWTHSVNTMITAMFGPNQVQLVENAGGELVPGPEQFSGEGLMTGHPTSGHPGARLVAGCIFANHAMFNAEYGSWDLRVHFVHNPSTLEPVPTGTFAPIPEYQLFEDAMRWTAPGASDAISMR